MEYRVNAGLPARDKPGGFNRAYHVIHFGSVAREIEGDGAEGMNPAEQFPPDTASPQVALPVAGGGCRLPAPVEKKKDDLHPCNHEVVGGMNPHQVFRRVAGFANGYGRDHRPVHEIGNGQIVSIDIIVQSRLVKGSLSGFLMALRA